MAKSPAWIAIVDDDASVLKSLNRLLSKRGFQARTYGSAREFLAALPEGLPACLVLDLQMPEMTGLELLHHLARSGVDIPTIMITANADPLVRERCISAGVIAYLQKPLQSATLLAAVEESRGGAR